MNKLIAIGVGLVGLSFLAATTQAQVITSIQFTRGQYGQGVPLTPTQSAGIPSESVADWNSETTYGPGRGNVQHDWSDGVFLTETNTLTLVTSTGAASPISYSVSSYGNITGGNGFTSGSNNYTMLNGAAATATGTHNSGVAFNPATLTLNGLNPGDSYQFIVYLSGGPSVAEEGSIGLNGGTTDYFLTPNGGYDLSPLSTFVATTHTSDFVAANGGSGSSVGTLPGGAESYSANYASFTDTDVSSATFTLNALGTYGGGGTFIESAADSATPVGIAGIEIIDTSAGGSSVPEPSSAGMIVLGLGGLAFMYLRRRVRA